MNLKIYGMFLKILGAFSEILGVFLKILGVFLKILGGFLGKRRRTFFIVRPHCPQTKTRGRPKFPAMIF